MPLHYPILQDILSSKKALPSYKESPEWETCPTGELRSFHPELPSQLLLFARHSIYTPNTSQLCFVPVSASPPSPPSPAFCQSLDLQLVQGPVTAQKGQTPESLLTSTRTWELHLEQTGWLQELRECKIQASVPSPDPHHWLCVRD